MFTEIEKGRGIVRIEKLLFSLQNCLKTELFSMKIDSSQYQGHINLLIVLGSSFRYGQFV